MDMVYQVNRTLRCRAARLRHLQLDASTSFVRLVAYLGCFTL